ncbi:MAG: Smr/MutS family protein [Anaerolineae bacterium]|nr:Smr/MutS family protein [Anaerolineae bacterium]
MHDQSASGATLWIEPLQTVESNNDYRELQIQEEKEVHRILRELCEFISHEAHYIIRSVEILSYLDLIFAKANYANTIRAFPPSLVDFKDRPDNPKHPGVTLKLVQARHPLLDPHKVVPIDLELDEETYVLVITGPNTGGKTVSLKTVGLMIMMAQCGLHIPAEKGSVISIFDEIYADIGDEQSIEQSLSTFSGHMTNIINILERANSRSLVILDELGAGTDPTEGSALARAILNRLVDSGITTLVTTHHPELKIYSQERKGVRNASVEFNLETLAPTYHLVVGLPGRSNALSIASRLGLPEDIIDDARHMVPVEDLVADDLLDEITKTREDLRHASEKATIAQQEAEALRHRLQEELDSIEIEKRDMLAETRRKAEYEMREFRKELKRMRKDLQSAGQPLDVIKTLERETDSLHINVDVPQSPASELVEENSKPLRLGDTVWINALKAEGVITELATEDAEVAVGQLRVRTKLDELEYRKAVKDKKSKQPAQRSGDLMPERGKSPGLELDLRGTRVEEAVTKVEEYLDAAYMAHLPFVRIIHGKGTGALRQAVRERLSHHPLIAKFVSGTEKEGGDGVTVVSFVENYKREG